MPWTWMDDDHIPESLKHERLGHSAPGMPGVYGHASDDARQALCEALTRRWEHSLEQRAALNPRSPLPLLDNMLKPSRE